MKVIFSHICEAMTHTLIAGLGDELPLTVYAGV